LHEHYGFNPTKKQFLRRAKEWGFEKNVKKEERRAILETVDEEGQFEERMLRGRRLDKAKLERWRKREGIVGSGFQNGPADSSSKSALMMKFNIDKIRNGRRNRRHQRRWSICIVEDGYL
jgi:hypothetical protein